MNTTTKILIGIGLVSVSGAIFYFYKNSSDESEIIGTNNDENKDNKVDTATTIDDELMNPEDQRLLDNLERYSNQKLDGGYRGTGRVPNTNIRDRRSSGSGSSLDPRRNPSRNIRRRAIRGNRTGSSGGRSSLNPSTDTRSRTISSRN